jgi:hypothetical protein
LLSPRLWRYFGWLLVVVAIASQAGIQRQFGASRFGFFNFDKIYQVTAACSLFDGEGVSERWANPDDLSSPRLTPVFHWPMGYSVVVAGVLRCLHNPFKAIQVVDYASIVVFFLAWFAILESLGSTISTGTKVILWSVWALVTCPLVPITSSEMLALTLFSLALLAGLRGVKSRRPALWGVGAAVAAVAAATVRYAYWPLLAVVPLGLAAAALAQQRRRPLLVAATTCAVLSGVLIGAFLAYQKHCFGRVTFLADFYSGKFGLYWAGLTHVFPFPASMVGFPDIWGALSAVYENCAAVAWFPLYWKVSIGVLAVLMLGGVHAFLTRTAAKQDPAVAAAARFFITAGILTILLTCGQLALLTLTTPSVPGSPVPGGVWTYMIEDRFYAPFASFVVVALAAALSGFWHAGHRGRFVLKGLVAVLLAAWLLAGLHGRYDQFVRRARFERPTRNATLADMKTMWTAVRRHRDAGRNVVYLERPGTPPDDDRPERTLKMAAQMFGACLMPVDVACRPLPAPKRDVALIGWVHDSEANRPDSIGGQIQNHGGFVRIARLWQGTLWETVVKGSQVFRPLGSPSPQAGRNGR